MKKLLAILFLAFASVGFAQQGISDLLVQRTVKFTGVITPTQLAANTNDWAPTSFSTAYKVRASTDASRNLTGLAGGAEGRQIVLSNVGSFALVLVDQSASSTTTNRFALGGANVTVSAGASVELNYDGTSSRWRLTGVPGATGTVTSVAASVPAFLSISGSPITDSGTLVMTYSGTALPAANGGTGLTSLGTGVATFLGTPSSSNLAAALMDETGTGAAVFGTSPRITTAILDTNGNELFNLTSTASAVNEITFANAATGNNPTFTASGGDSNVGINFLTKGTGIYEFKAPTAGAIIRINKNGAYNYHLGLDGSSNFNVYDNDGTTIRLQIVQTTGGLNVPVNIASTTTSTGSIISGGGVGVAGQVTAGNVADTALTSGRVTFASTSGLLADDADFTFATDTLTVTKLVVPTSITMNAAALLSITSGTNQRAGNATLVGGTVTVSNTTVTANTVVMLTRKTSGGTIGTAITYTVSAATSFTVNSDNILDTSTFSYFLIEVP